ncbi:hypothetical protein HDV00_007076 [Rhizophlyctis rosea]|nr:hypothetical protein HDV00_007076 [Rhizophlyctis rosea]
MWESTSQRRKRAQSFPFPQAATVDDFLDRLVTSLKQSPARIRTSNSLHKFQRAWDDIVVEHKLESNWTRQVSQTDIPNALEQLLDILVKEQAVMNDGLETGRCTELFLNDDMLGQLVEISENDVPLGFRSEVIHFLSSLISLLDGRILFQATLHRATLKLMKSCLADKDKKYEDAMLELENSIAFKIHELPQLLEMFFTKKFVPRNVSVSSLPASATTAAATSNPAPSSIDQFEFPLFDHLMQYVHLEGRRGDYARTSCMFLLELATGDLQEYITASDFATIAVAGLGGLYSQLPQALPDPPASRPGARPSYAWATFTKDLESFLHLLRFVQDVLLKCPSPAITEAIRHELAVTLLDNVVKATITTASDFNGTTVAMLFYLQQMLETIREDHLSELFVNFLLKSEEENEDEDPSTPSEIQLHIRDILISKLNSLSEEVVTGILRLIQSMLENHSSRALHLLIERLPPRKAGFQGISPLLWERSPTDMVIMDVDQHLAVVTRYFALVQPDTPAATRETAIEAYLQDAEKFVKTYSRVLPKGAVMNPKIFPRSSSLYATGRAVGGGSGSVATATYSSAGTGERPPIDPRVLEQMRRVGRDPTLNKLLKKFSGFFGHSMGINLALTGVLTQLCSVPEPVLYTYLFSGDILLPDSPGAVPSLFATIVKLGKEIEERRGGIEGYEGRLEKGREVEGGEGVELNLEKEFLKNVVVLEEFMKEVLAVLVMHGSREYDEVSYL